ncbi:hypothetical protein [Leifsonia sp. Leaf264]|uniref:hypothetical protein n=1 Tax=Leifsonia sp. Leaf264 TaxID=1736314 RepID=UPI0006F85DDE|nr:hypothetical protein [Leifsonia sp. Leaf264]KQO95413.1 hypothetical protein ASF30_20565 [Leifsonia sp. Leaf264]
MIPGVLRRNLQVRVLTTPFVLASSFTTAWLVIGHIGANAYGILLLVTGLAQLLPFVDFGVGAAVMNVLGAGQTAADSVRLTLISAQRVLLLSSTGVVVVAGVLALVPGWNILLGVEYADANWVVLAFAAAFGGLVASQLGQRVLIGVGRNQLWMILGTCSAVMTLVGSAAAVALDAGITWFAVIPTLCGLVVSIIAGTVGSRAVGLRYRDIVIGALHPRRYPAVPLAATALPMIVIMVGIPLVLHSDRWIISHVLGDAMLAEYTIAAQVYIPLWTASSTALVALWPVFAAARTSDVGAALRGLFRSSIGIFVAALLCCVAFAALLPFATSVLSHGESTASISLSLAFAALLLIQITFYPAGVYMTSPSDLRFQAVCIMFMIAIGIPASIWATNVVGVPGPVWVSAAAILLFQALPATVRLLRRYRNEKALDRV